MDTTFSNVLMLKRIRANIPGLIRRSFLTNRRLIFLVREISPLHLRCRHLLQYTPESYGFRVFTQTYQRRFPLV
jgi:hypothetical protein